MLTTFDRSTVNQVQQATDIVDVVSEHVSLKRKGREMVGLCPFHEDHRPSMHVSDIKQIFKCFACGAGGDVFKFIQLRENLTFPQAVERLAHRVGITLKKFKTQNSKLKTVDIDPNKLAKVNAWATDYFQANLDNQQKGKAVRDYIAQRQITPESAKKWQLGLAVSNNDLLTAAKAKRIPEKLLADAGLTVNQAGTTNDKFVNRLMFTITDVTGRKIGFGARTLDGSGAKYINSPTTPLFDKSNCLYGLQHARHEIVSTGTAVVVEGYTDCIMAHQFGCHNVVASLGTSFTAGHGRILRRYAKQVVVVFDSDTAGIEAANRALEVCLSQHIDIKIASVPQGDDPCDFLLTAGKKGFEELIAGAVDVFKFKWDRLNETFASDDTFAGRKKATDEFLQTVTAALHTGTLSPIERGLIVNRLAKIIGMDTKEINIELSNRLTRAKRNTAYHIENQKVQSLDLGEGLFAAAQREILEVLLNEPKLFDNVKQTITAETFDVPVLSRIAGILFETLQADPSAGLAAILTRVDSVELSSAIVQLAQAGERKGNFQSRIEDALELTRRYQQDLKKNALSPADNQIEFLRQVCQNAEKQNPRNLGMT